jgi:hypothetical protein
MDLVAQIPNVIRYQTTNPTSTCFAKQTARSYTFAAAASQQGNLWVRDPKLQGVSRLVSHRFHRAAPTCNTTTAAANTLQQAVLKFWPVLEYLTISCIFYRLLSLTARLACARSPYQQAVRGSRLEP